MTAAVADFGAEAAAATDDSGVKVAAAAAAESECRAEKTEAGWVDAAGWTAEAEEWAEAAVFVDVVLEEAEEEAEKKNVEAEKELDALTDRAARLYDAFVGPLVRAVRARTDLPAETVARVTATEQRLLNREFISYTTEPEARALVDELVRFAQEMRHLLA